MSTTVNKVITLLNQYTGESTEDRISNAERLSIISEVTTDVKQQMKSEMSNMTYQVDFIPGIYYYKVDNATYNVLAAADVRVDEYDGTNAKYDVPFTRSGADKINEDIRKLRHDTSFALDRYDKDLYLVINYEPRNNKTLLTGADDLTEVTASDDATNASIDENEALYGNSLKFDIDVSNSGNDYATIQFDIDDQDLSTLEDVGVVIGSVFLEDATEVSSIAIQLKTDASNYWTFTATSAYNESGFVNGWNKIVVNWSDAVKVSSPDASDITLVDVIINYSGSQTDMVARIDDISVARPTKLKFHYLSYSVGTDSSGNEILEFTATTDIPYYSGQYDNLNYVVARFAAAVIYQNLRLFEYAQFQENKGMAKLKEVMEMVPSQHKPETKAFRPYGINLSGKKRLR